MSISKFLGIPYLDGGRTREGCDCWGLCMLYYAEVYGINLLDAKYTSDCEHAGLIAEYMHRGFKRVKKPQAGDFVLICNKGDVPNHIGVVLSSLQFLHALENSGSVVSYLKKWEGNIYGFYRQV